MTSQLRMSLCIGMLIYFIIIFFFLRKKSLSLKYTLLWIAFGTVMLLVVAFPDILNTIHLLGISSPVNGIFAIIQFAILTILISITSIVSKFNEKIKRLIQVNAELEKRIRDLETLLTEDNKKE